MCEFLSFVTRGSQKYYFNWEQRKNLLKNNPNGFDPDSHTSICYNYGLNVDKVNKYEFNPLTGAFNIDQINIKDDRALAKKWVERLNISKIVEPLIIKSIINPLELPAPNLTIEHIQLLHKWASVRASVGDSVGDFIRSSVKDSVGTSVRNAAWTSAKTFVRDSVGTSVGDSVGVSIKDSVEASIWTSVGTSVWASIKASIRDFIWNSVWDSVWDSLWGYMSSFFNIKYPYDFTSIIKLWEIGIVPSYDSKIWRLHSGKKANVIYEVEIK